MLHMMEEATDQIKRAVVAPVAVHIASAAGLASLAPFRMGQMGQTMIMVTAAVHIAPAAAVVVRPPPPPKKQASTILAPALAHSL